MPKISVIIPTYNCARLLPDAINSILDQTFQDFEIIIIDDGSSDNTKEVVDTYKEKYPEKIRYFYQNNKGVSGARNTGIKHARGSYLCLFDADDIMMKDSLSLRQDFLDRNPDVSLVFTDYYIQHHVGEQPGNTVLKENNFLNYLHKAVLKQDRDGVIFNSEFYYYYFVFSPRPIWVCSVMMRKEVIADVGSFREDLLSSEDNEYWLRAVRTCRVGFINLPTCYYRHVFSKQTKGNERYYIYSIVFLREVYLHDKERKMRIIAKHKLADTYYDLGYFYYKNGYAVPLARKNLFLSIRYNPFMFGSFKTLFATFVRQGNILCQK